MTEADNYLVKRMSFPESIEDLIQYTSGLEYVGDKLREFKFNLKHHGRKYTLNTWLYRLKYYSGFYAKYENIDWKKVERLVFVCKGNICRSPYAEIKAESLGLDAISIGLYTKEGSPANEQAIQSASYRNVILNEHSAITYKSVRITESDLIICMEPSHIKKFKKVDKSNCQISLLGLHLPRKVISIYDPYGKPGIFFDDCFRDIDIAISNIRKNID